MKDMLTGGKILVSVIVVTFILGLAGLGFQKFFSPKSQNIKREVWENTQSYVEGAVVDLAEYFEQYQRAESDDRESIRAVVVMRFANLDAEKVNNANLRTFLTQMRGY